MNGTIAKCETESNAEQLDNIVSVQVRPGETALAFYTATNPTDKAVIGISTYNIIPYEAGPYFNKIQVFQHVRKCIVAR